MTASIRASSRLTTADRAALVVPRSSLSLRVLDPRRCFFAALAIGVAGVTLAPPSASAQTIPLDPGPYPFLRYEQTCRTLADLAARAGRPRPFRPCTGLPRSLLYDEVCRSRHVARRPTGDRAGLRTFRFRARGCERPRSLRRGSLLRDLGEWFPPRPSPHPSDGDTP